MAANVVDNPQADRFEIHVDGELAGVVQYHRQDTTISLMHTVVDPRFEGKGYASALARSVLDAARAEGLAVLPFCPYIRGYLQRHPEYVDLVPPDERARFGLAMP
jgi:predicted GNAT family acetyltransferase